MSHTAFPRPDCLDDVDCMSRRDGREALEHADDAA